MDCNWHCRPAPPDFCRQDGSRAHPLDPSARASRSCEVQRLFHGRVSADLFRRQPPDSASPTEGSIRAGAVLGKVARSVSLYLVLVSNLINGLAIVRAPGFSAALYDLLHSGLDVADC